MSRFKCEKKGECLRCAGCCHFRESAVLSDEQDLVLRKQMWDAKSILYAFPFFRYTISLSNHEKQVMEQKAEELGIEIKFIPKKIMFDSAQKPVVLDWCVDADVCPFLKGDSCLIYPVRPEVCKTFPKNFMPAVDVDILKQNFSFKEALDIVLRVLKL